MKTIEDYMNAPYRMEIAPDDAEGGFAVSFPDLPGCLTCGETLEGALKNAEDAKRAWFKAALEDGYPIPAPNSTEEYSGQFKLRMPKRLHRLLAERSKQEGVSMNQYCVFLLSSKI